MRRVKNVAISRLLKVGGFMRGVELREGLDLTRVLKKL